MLTRPRSIALPLIALLVIGAWIFWLRWPTFGWKIWNMDEGIYATIGRVILDGGVMYRDAIDNRTPLTHYLSAAIYGLVGVNNQWGAHAVLAGIISVTGVGVLLIARRWFGVAAAVCSMLAFAAYASFLLYEGDAYSLGTEWFVIFFTTWGAWWFLRTWERRTFWSPFLAGACYAAAFLSKQPGLLDFGAPLALAVYLAATQRLRLIEAARVLAGLACGFTALTAAVFAYFWANDALQDLYLYAWVFNMVYYTTETSVADRLGAASALASGLWNTFPLLCLAVAATLIAQFQTLVQRRPNETERAAQIPAFFLLTWLLCSLAGASAAGRVYGHYYIQTIPPLALATGWLVPLAAGWLRNTARWPLRAAGVVVLLLVGWSLIAVPVKRRGKAFFHRDAGIVVGDYIRQNSSATAKIFVWGFNPDLYMFADRAPATRFIYCGFQTGLIPWTNAEPNVDTSYAIIPGTMEVLLGDLERGRPEFFVDGGLGAGRMFAKYPLEKFPRLAAFAAKHYVEIEPLRFRPQGFRLLALKDASRRSPPALAGGAAQSKLTPPTVIGPPTITAAATAFMVKGIDAAHGLQRLELLVDGNVFSGITFHPTERLDASFLVETAVLGPGRHEIVARATSASGESLTGAPYVTEVSPASLPAESRAEFLLPIASAGIAPEHISGPFGANVKRNGDDVLFAAHAPAVMRYTLSPKGARLNGHFGIDDGASAPGKPDPTDGAEFIVEWVPARGQRVQLAYRHLNPIAFPGDRGRQPLSCQLPAGDELGTLELIITPGPAGNATSDWTYWSNLQLFLPK